MAIKVSESAHHLLAILTKMGELKTNPVLLTLPDPNHIELKHKYYIPAFQTDNHNFKCFYHCHSYPDRKNTEHGHFHFFTKAKESKKWQHLAALSMNHQGQPEQWITVNQWVTDSVWIEQKNLNTLFNELSNYEPENLLHDWIITITILYSDQLIKLIDQRDQQLSLIKANTNGSDIISNRNIYQLSSSNIFLAEKLNEHISALV